MHGAGVEGAHGIVDRHEDVVDGVVRWGGRRVLGACCGGGVAGILVAVCCSGWWSIVSAVDADGIWDL